MRKLFKEHFPQNDEDLKRNWKEAIFSVDANVILNLYRYSKDTQKEILDVLAHLKTKNRLWLSYQAAYEYFKNRLAVIQYQKDAYGNLLKLLNESKSTIDTKIQEYKRHPYLIHSELTQLVDDAFKSVILKITELEKEHPDLIYIDIIRDKVADIFKECIGDEPSEEEYDSLFKSGKKRYANNIPPGYSDQVTKKNMPEHSLYDDFIIWEQIMEFSKNGKKDIIFVTDDLKEDWWLIHKGKTISARPELFKEFYSRSKQNILIYKPEQFLQYAKDYLDQKVDDKVIEEVENVRKSDEVSSEIFKDNTEERIGELLDRYELLKFNNQFSHSQSLENEINSVVLRNWLKIGEIKNSTQIDELVKMRGGVRNNLKNDLLRNHDFDSYTGTFLSHKNKQTNSKLEDLNSDKDEKPTED